MLFYEVVWYHMRATYWQDQEFSWRFCWLRCVLKKSKKETNTRYSSIKRVSSAFGPASGSWTASLEQVRWLQPLDFMGQWFCRTAERRECWHLQISADLWKRREIGYNWRIFCDAKQSSNVFSMASTHPQYHMRSSQGSKKPAETATSLYSLKGAQLVKKTESCLRVETQPAVPV